MPRVVRFPPDLVAELEELVPYRKRSAFIHEQVRLGIRRLRRKLARETSQGEEGKEAQP